MALSNSEIELQLRCINDCLAGLVGSVGGTFTPSSADTLTNKIISGTNNTITGISYLGLTNKPTIPTNTNDLTNNSQFVVGNGTNAQYIAGDGSKITFPTIPTNSQYVDLSSDQTAIAGLKTFTKNASFTDDYANYQLTIGKVGQAGNIQLLGGTSGQALKMGATSLTSNNAQISAVNGTLTISAPSNNANVLISSNGSNGIVHIQSNSTTGTLKFTAGANQGAQIFNNSNFLIQNGGTFTDGGQQLQVIGTSIFTGQMSLTGSAAGAAGTAPLKLPVGTLLATTEASAIETNGDLITYTIPTGAGTAAARKNIALAETGLSTTRMLYTSSTSRITHDSLFTYTTARGGSLLIGTTSGFASLTVGQVVQASGTNQILNITPAAHTNQTTATESIDVYFNLGRTVQFAAGAKTTQRAFLIQAPTYSFVSASTITNAATFAINNSPQVGSLATITNSYALWIQAGISQFDGGINATGLSTFADNTAAAALATNTLYKTATGELRIKV